MRKLSFVEFVKTQNKTLFVAMILGAVAIAAYGFIVNTQTVSFLGIAESTETNISFEYPVNIKRIYVISGQTVKKGDLLAELSQNYLETRLREISGQIQKLNAQLVLKEAFSEAIGKSTANSSDFAAPEKIDLEYLEKEKAYLEAQRKNLFIYAEHDGVVGSVNFKAGEKAQSFTILMSVSNPQPGYVKGYIHESLYPEIAIGQELLVTSVADPRKAIVGHVASLGSRIVPLPERLLHNPSALSYGREIVIELPSNNSFLLGEKINLTRKSKMLSGMRAFIFPKAVAEHATDAILQAPIPDNILPRFRIEASGAVFLNDTRETMFVTDETRASQGAVVFYLNSDGRIDQEYSLIPELSIMDDIEAIAHDGGFIYIMSSLQKSRHEVKSRGLFSRLKRDGKQLILDEKVDLRELLIQALTEFDQLSPYGINNEDLMQLETEAFAIKGNDLWIALKSPVVLNNKSIILDIKNFTELFSTHKLRSESVSVLTILSFKDEFKIKISDMVLVEDSLYLTTACEEPSLCGHVWKVATSDWRSELLASYKNEQPEGIAYDSAKNELTVIFDKPNEGYLPYAKVPLRP